MNTTGPAEKWGFFMSVLFTLTYQNITLHRSK